MRMVAVSFLVLCRKQWQFVALSVILGMSVAVRQWVHFNMIDTVSRGIKKISDEQWRRYFPMSDYEIDAANKVVGVWLYGNAINEKYTKILKENKTLTLQECIALDAVQKGHQINEDTAKELDKGLIEGEYPNYQISLGVAKMTHLLPE